MFDTINPNSPFANVKVRQAVIHAIDNEAIVKSVRRGLGFFPRISGINRVCGRTIPM